MSLTCHARTPFPPSFYPLATRFLCSFPGSYQVPTIHFIYAIDCIFACTSYASNPMISFPKRFSLTSDVVVAKWSLTACKLLRKKGSYHIPAEIRGERAYVLPSLSRGANPSGAHQPLYAATSPQPIRHATTDAAILFLSFRSATAWRGH